MSLSTHDHHIRAAFNTELLYRHHPRRFGMIYMLETTCCLQGSMSLHMCLSGGSRRIHVEWMKPDQTFIENLLTK